jgi:hypothetical protein
VGDGLLYDFGDSNGGSIVNDNFAFWPAPLTVPNTTVFMRGAAPGD